MRHVYSLILGLSSLAVSAQTLSAPIPQGVYGGRVLAMDQIVTGPSASRLYFSTESANSLFYMDIRYSSGYAIYDSVHPVPAADWDDGYGSDVHAVQGFETTGEAFFLANGTIYKVDPFASSATSVLNMAKNFIIETNTFVAVLNGMTQTSNDSLVWGTLNTSGGLTISGGMGLTHQFNGAPKMIVDPLTNHLYLFEGGTTPYQMKIAANIHSLSSGASISSAVNPAPVDPNIEWITFGISPTGDWYVAGAPVFGAPPSTDKKIAISSDNGLTWNTSDFALPGPPGGTPGPNFAFTAVGAVRYAVYCGVAFSDSIGAPGSWREIGRAYTGNNNRANDGVVVIDMYNQGTTFITTNVGLGVSTYAADTVKGANLGLTAVQVNGIDMTDSYATGWFASKSGIRKVSAYKSSTPLWSDPIFPGGDGSPYYSVAIDPSDSLTVYVGNGRIYKTESGGAPTSSAPDGWTLVFDPMMGGTHGGTYNFPRIGTRVTGLAVSPLDPNIVYATYTLENTDDGGIFVSTDGGATWTQEMIVTGAPGMDVDATDVVAVEESGKSVFYVSLASDPMTSGYYGIYRFAESGSGSRTKTAESAFGATDGIYKLSLTSGRDSLLAVYRTSSAINPPNRIYIKDIASSTWSYIVGPSGAVPTALTSGDGYIFTARDHEIYSHPIDSAAGSWTLAYSYPVGTKINVLYYDELLVGAGTGLYAHDWRGSIGLPENIAKSRAFPVYPVPSSNSLYWDVRDDVTIFDLHGIIHLSEEDVDHIDVSRLPKGVYIIQGEQIGIQRFVIQ
ncbi:MAG: T9SS type A sorting domain-containing protein [Bacteroidetes bacterium]|nr:MAG: T9SS type A sorting domain-containing protein [Bacteroidota bacterium]